MTEILEQTDTDFMSEEIPEERKPKRGRPPTAQLRTLKAFMSDVRGAAEFAEGLRAELAELPGGPDTDFIFRTAQAVFEADVARRGDLKQHIALRRLRQIDRTQDENHLQRERAIEQRERALALSRERFEFDAAEVVLDHLGELKAILQARSLTRPAKIEAVRRRLFGEGPLRGVAGCDAPAARCELRVAKTDAGGGEYAPFTGERGMETREELWVAGREEGEGGVRKDLLPEAGEFSDPLLP